MNNANKLTMVRIALVPAFMAAFYLDSSERKYIALILFVIASVTDFLDGYVARKYNLITDFGKIMDAIADKVLVCSALIMLSEYGRVSGIITLIIIGRDFLISGLRVVAASKGNVIAAGKTGKWKTATLMIAIVMFISFDPNLSTVPLWYKYSAYGVLYLSVFFSLWSAWEYIYKNKQLFEDR